MGFAHMIAESVSSSHSYSIHGSPEPNQMNKSKGGPRFLFVYKLTLKRPKNYKIMYVSLKYTCNEKQNYYFDGTSRCINGLCGS